MYRTTEECRFWFDSFVAKAQREDITHNSKCLPVVWKLILKKRLLVTKVNKLDVYLNRLDFNKMSGHPKHQDLPTTELPAKFQSKPLDGRQKTR